MARNDERQVVYGGGGPPKMFPPGTSGNFGSFTPGAQAMMNPLMQASPFAMSRPSIPSIGGMGGMRPPAMMQAPSDPPGMEPKREGFLPAIGDLLKDYGPLALAGLSAWEGHKQSKKQDEMIERSIAEEEARKKMVAEGRARRDAMPQADYSDLYDDPGNPYRKRRSIPSVGGY